MINCKRSPRRDRLSKTVIEAVVLDSDHLISLALLFNTLLSGRKVWGSIPEPVKSDTVLPTGHHRCDVSSELCSLGFKSRKWTQ